MRSPILQLTLPPSKPRFPLLPAMIARSNEGTAPAKGAVPFLQLCDAVVRRQGRDILRVDRFTLAEGESVAILGPNGSGKSTFIGLITREVLPLYRDEPPVLFRGEPRATLVDVRRALGIVSASMQSEITVHLPVLDIVAGGLTGTLGLPFHVPPEQAEAARCAARRPLEFLGIADLAGRDATTLSTGQGRRVLIARALMGDPDVLVLDEPTTGLDPQGMFHIRRALSDLAQAGKGIVLVTHYPQDVVPEIGRIALIKDGCLYADGPKDQLLTSETMSRLFGVPLTVVTRDGRTALL